MRTVRLPYDIELSFLPISRARPAPSATQLSVTEAGIWPLGVGIWPQSLHPVDQQFYRR
jgi:hypothetical protein